MEERLWLLVLYVLTYVEWISFYCVVLKEKLTKPTRKRLIVFLLLLTLRIAGIVFWGHRYFLFDVVWIVFCWCFFTMKIIRTLKKWLFSYVVILVLETSVACVLKAFEMYSASSRIIGAIRCASIVIVIICLYHILIGNKINKEHLILPKRVWHLLVGVLLLIMLMMTYFSFVISEIPDLTMIRVGSIVILLGGLSISGMIMAVIYYFNGTEKYRLQNEMAEKYNEQQREYFVKLLEKEQDTRRFRHDIINHLIVMQDIANKENSEQLGRYIGSLLQDISGVQHKQYDVGNEVVNTILNYYLSPIKEECDIKVDGYMGEITNVSQKDLCTITSNIIKNAVEVMTNVSKENRQICVDVNCGEMYLSITVENTTESHVKIGSDGWPQTSKVDKDNHGIGLVSTKSIVEKYNGKYEIKIENQRFITNIYLKI